MKAAQESLLLIFLKIRRSTSDQCANAANVEMEPEDAFSDFASETLKSHQGVNVVSTSGISAETQTEAFDHLCRKPSKHELPDVDAETQTQAFDYLFRKSSDSKAPDRDAETQTEGLDYLISMRSGYQAPDNEFFKADERVRFYTGLPFYEILMVMFEQVAPHVNVNRRTQTLNKHQHIIYGAGEIWGPVKRICIGIMELILQF